MPDAQMSCTAETCRLVTAPGVSSASIVTLTGAMATLSYLGSALVATCVTLTVSSPTSLARMVIFCRFFQFSGVKVSVVVAASTLVFLNRSVSIADCAAAGGDETISSAPSRENRAENSSTRRAAGKFSEMAEVIENDSIHQFF